MQLLALLAAATGAAAVAMPNAGGVGNGHSKGWGLKKFKNLVAFGDRYVRPF